MPARNNYVSEEKLSNRIDSYRWFLVILNILSLIVGIVTFAICIWIRSAGQKRMLQFLSQQLH